MFKKIDMKNASRGEIAVWNEMKKELSKHDSYHVRKSYYPDRLNEWEAEHIKIEMAYREQIANMQNERKIRTQARKEEEDRIEAAMALIKLSEPKRKRTPVNPTPVRRSKRIAGKINPLY